MIITLYLYSVLYQYFIINQIKSFSFFFNFFSFQVKVISFILMWCIFYQSFLCCNIFYLHSYKWILILPLNSFLFFSIVCIYHIEPNYQYHTPILCISIFISSSLSLFFLKIGILMSSVIMHLIHLTIPQFPGTIFLEIIRNWGVFWKGTSQGSYKFINGKL